MRKLSVIFILSLVFLMSCSSAFKQIQKDAYEVITYGSSEDTAIFIKYSTITGQAWILADVWEPIPDDEELPDSRYQIKVVTVGGRKYTAVRIDTNTGRSWSSIDNRWVEIKTEKKHLR